MAWMARRAKVAVVLVAMGCPAADDASEGGAGDESSGPGASSDPDVDGGGGDGMAECSDDADCLADGQSTVDAAVAAQVVEPYISSRCEPALASDWPCGVGFGDVMGEPACLCFTDPERWDLLSAEPSSCLIFGRGDTCLYAPAEFPGCDLGAPDTSCVEICAEVDQRRQEHAEAILEGEVRSAACGAGVCEIVLRIGDRCYTQGSYWAHRAYDCALGDAEILQMERDRPLDCVDTSPAPTGECPRDPNEWQGMRVPLGEEQICTESSICGLALACLDGGCTCCTADDQCATGEACVLDHCVLEELVECRSYTDCAAGELCILSGLSGGAPRGNEDMRAYCLPTSGGADSGG